MIRFLARVGRVAGWLKTAWLILGVTLVLVVLLELALRGAFWLKDRGRPQVPPDPLVLAAIPDSRLWLPVHYQELADLSDRWQPYVYFRQRPFLGKTITVQDDGTRATWQPPPLAGAGAGGKPLKILMLGGSSLWGYGARDDETIPSLVGAGCTNGASAPRSGTSRRSVM